MGDKGMQKIDPLDHQQRLDRITEIFAGMVTHADEQAAYRCPYRDRFDQCTAKFRCTNQAKTAVKGAVKGAVEGELPGCEHDGRFDYRSAWESDPQSYDRAKAKIEQIHSNASRLRA